jgi:hypothetical protein
MKRWSGMTRERGRGYVLLVVALIGLVAEVISTIQDGVSAAKLVALTCFVFLFWYGWELAHPTKPKRPQ